MKEQHGPTRESQDSPSSASSERQEGSLRHDQEKRLFKNYDLVRRIDVGGMGEVYLARQRTAFGREVAVKIIRSDLVHDVSTRKRFLREAEVSAHLKHDHILPLVEFGEEQGRLFLVTPYIAGGTLARRLQNGPLPLSEVHPLFSALVKAVAYIHKRGVIHRDLKPSNILLDSQEGSGQTYVRLIDFGIASIQGRSASPALTIGGQEMGTVAYMAPERLNGVAAPSNDIYSLGIILYQMLTGQLPDTEKIVALPAALDAVVRRGTAFDPQKRFTSAEELLHAFEQAYRTLNSSPRVQASAPLAAPKPAMTPPPSPLPQPPQSSQSSQSPHPPNPPKKSSAQERASLAQSASLAPMQPKLGGTFKHEDYDAPTASLDPAHFSIGHKPSSDQTEASSIPPSPPKPRRRNRSLFTLVSLSILVVLFIIAGIAAFAFQTAISANVAITPQTRAVSKVFTMTAKPTQHTVDATTMTIPADVITSTKSGKQQGPTTGKADCRLVIFDCKQAVSDFDVSALSAQIQPSVREQIGQDLQRQAQTSGTTTVGNIVYSDPSASANPAVGTVSKTVTVTYTERGSIEGVKMSNAQNLARLLLQQEAHRLLGQHGALLDQLTQVSPLAIQQVDADGNVTLQVAAAGVAQYQFSQDEIQHMQNALKGMKVTAARAFLAKQPGVDADELKISVTYGSDTLPNTVQQIKVLTSNPTHLPPVQLTPVHATANSA